MPLNLETEGTEVSGKSESESCQGSVVHPIDNYGKETERPVVPQHLKCCLVRVCVWHSFHDVLAFLANFTRFSNKHH